MAETFADRAKREGDARRAAIAAEQRRKAAQPKPAQPKPNTGKSQSTGGVLKSLLPGGQKANLGGLGQSAKNIAGEVSGVYDIKRGVTELGKGNIAGGLGRIGMGAIGLVPIVGTAARGATSALRAANVLSKASKGNTFVSAATKGERAIMSPLIKPKVITPRPTTAGRLGQKVTRNLPSKASSPYALATFGAPVVSGIVSGIKSGLAPTATATAPVPVGAPERAWQQTQLAARLLGQSMPTPTTQGPTITGGGVTPTGTGSTPETPDVVVPSFGTETPSVTVPSFGDIVGTGSTETPGISTSTEKTGALTTGGGAAAMGGATPVGLPGGVQVAGADYAANLAAAAAQSYGRQAGLREALAQGIEGTQGRAADIIGGRSQAILGQGITGQRREYQTGMAAETQRQVGEQEASRRAYNEAVNQAYAQQAQQILDRAQARSEQAAQIRRIG